MRARLLRAFLAAAIVAAVVGVGTSAAGFVPGPNSTEYWEAQLGHSAQCFKHEGNSSHGVDNGDGSVTLNTFNQAWPGDHWEALIVKSGSVDVGHGPGNELYLHPSAGVPYFGPLNAGGQQGAVSHWIVCKGTTPDTTTTTTTTIVETTTTTVPRTTTTTVPETTTTTVPETTTTTTVPETTTTVPETTTTTIVTTTTTDPSTTTSLPPSIETGDGGYVDEGLEWWHLAALSFFTVLLIWSFVEWRRAARKETITY